MKRKILAVLVVTLFATPCFAQGIKSDGIFSIDGTLWRSIALSHFKEPIPFYWGFWGGSVYQGISETGPFLPTEVSPDSPCTLSSFYNDLPLFSTYLFISICPLEEEYSIATYAGALFSPTGIGFTVYWGTGIGSTEQGEFAMYVLRKINNDWTPPEVDQSL